jgi:hypothetical protein
LMVFLMDLSILVVDHGFNPSMIHLQREFSSLTR